MRMSIWRKKIPLPAVDDPEDTLSLRTAPSSDTMSSLSLTSAPSSHASSLSREEHTFFDGIKRRHPGVVWQRVELCAYVRAAVLFIALTAALVVAVLVLYYLLHQ